MYAGYINIIIRLWKLPKSQEKNLDQPLALMQPLAPLTPCSSVHSGFMRSMIDMFVCLSIHDTLSTLLQHHNSKASIFLLSYFLIVQVSAPYRTIGNTNTFTSFTFVSSVTTPYCPTTLRHEDNMTGCGYGVAIRSASVDCSWCDLSSIAYAYKLINDRYIITPKSRFDRHPCKLVSL